VSDRLSILRDIESPPGGWSFKVEATGQTITGPYAAGVIGKVEQHMIANAVPILPDFEEWVEDELCRQNGHGGPWCGKKGKPIGTLVGKVFHTMASARRFLRTVVHAILAGKLVEREEALRRAAICLSCPEATDIGGCWGCSGLLKTIERAIPNNPVKMPKEKEFCGKCDCWLRAKCWLPNEVLDKAEAGDRPEYWSECWRNAPVQGAGEPE